MAVTLIPINLNRLLVSSFASQQLAELVCRLSLPQGETLSSGKRAEFDTFLKVTDPTGEQRVGNPTCAIFFLAVFVPTVSSFHLMRKQ
jgi:hypothetical protein